MARHTIRLTVDNLDALHAGDVIVDAEDLGPVRSVRETCDGYRNAVVCGQTSRDIFSLPATLEVERDA